MNMHSWLASERSAAEVRLTKFKQDLDGPLLPFFAFEGCDGVMRAAAMLRLVKEMERDLAGGATPADLLEAARADVVRTASHRPSSTSPSHNLMDDYLMEATAKMVDASRWWDPVAPTAAVEAES